MKVFLLLQSVCSPFFRELAVALTQAGHQVIKLNFNVGDTWYHWPQPALSYRGRLDDLPAYLATLYAQYGVTDQLLFGDQRPVHQRALAAGRAAGVRNFVFEEGYFRPSWVTLEREGVNACSLLPRDPNWYLQAAAMLGQPDVYRACHSPFWLRALHDVLYHCGSFWNWLFYPHYRTHALLSAPQEYLGYCWRLPAQRWFVKNDAPILAQLAGQHWFLLPLQLDGDAQIRQHSSIGNMTALLKLVLTDFRENAPAHSQLLIKNHPLDPGWTNYGAVVRRLLRQLGLLQRVYYVQSGDLAALLPHCAGVVTVNSTVGLQALQFGLPVCALGTAIYNMPGLTFQGPLADFWLKGQAPDAPLLRAFLAVLQHCTQLNGNLYGGPGLALLVQQSVDALCREQSPLEELCTRLNASKQSAVC